MHKIFKPLNGYITVSMDGKDEKNEDGFFTSVEGDSKIPEGKVLAVSDEAAGMVEPGDIVVYGGNSALSFKLNDEEILIINKDAIFGKYDK